VRGCLPGGKPQRGADFPGRGCGDSIAGLTLNPHRQ
jgi:hypothetical protein